ncbi:MAG: class I SAM-dependent methyltransferase [Phycisphaerales bacterium]|nr:class I SAM-dependent methyltransferase [Phycisphaerales bacterium]
MASGRFTERATVYAASRPSYPDDAIDRILAAHPGPSDVVDIGAGTGISSRLIAQRGHRVIAVEPDDAMRERGCAAGGDIEWHRGRGEHTGLPDASADIVLCAQAFHWLDAAAATAEFRRILRRPGRIALMWNVHDVSVPLMAAYREIMLRHATDPPRSPWYRGFNDALAGAAVDLDFSVSRHRMSQVVDREGLLGRALSSSYVPMEGPGHAALCVDLDHLFEAHCEGEQLTLWYETSVYIAEVT